MTDISKLLAEARLILEKAKVAQQESRQRGEQFNIFHACGVNHYETTHSAIIAEFLNPEGSHGQGDVYLKAFIDVVSFDFQFDTSTAKVMTEFPTSYGRLDFLITNAKGQAIIIENKIYAGDQRGQLKRYNKFACKKYHTGNYAILYLTLWGDEASEQSGEGVDYMCISYRDTILRWLERCIQISAQKPLIHETMIQYANLIKELTNQTMDTTNKNELLQLMITHPEATAAICDTQWDYTKYVWEKTIRPALQGLASAMKLEYEDTGDLWNGRKYSGFSFKKDHWGCYFEAGKTGMYDLYYGFDFEGIAKKLKPKIPLFGGFQNKNSAWPYGLAWLDDRYVNWDMKTLADIVTNTDDFVKYIKGKIQVVLDELERLGIRLE